MRIRVDPAVVQASFAKVADNLALQESAQLFAAGRPVLEMVQALSLSPAVLRAFAGLAEVYPGGSLERPLMEKVILRVSQLHECQFCVASHLDIMGALGVGTDLSPAGVHTSREQLAVAYAELVTRDANRIPDSFFVRLRAEFNEAEIVELTFLIGLITLLNRFNNALQVRYSGELRDVRVR